jgi:FAD:protein FMN transferase
MERGALSTSRRKFITSLLIIITFYCGANSPVQFNVRAAFSQPFDVSPPTPQRAALDRFTFSELHMGVRTNITVYARNSEQARRACSRAFARMAQLENVMSDYRINSELNQLNAHAGGPPLPISADLFFVLSHAQEMARISDGAFDVTAGPLIRLWRRVRKSGALPAPSELKAARALVNWRWLKLNRAQRSAQLLKAGMQLDLGGIAKGYAGDCVLDALRRQGLPHALFEAGGDVVLGEAPPGTRGWMVEIENYKDSQSRTLPLANCAISTSGDTNQFVIIGGKRYSHIVNPATGLGLTNRRAVTVIAPRGITTDALSTALSITDRHAHRLQRAFPDAKIYVRPLSSL